MDSGKWIKIAGIGLSVVGAIVGVASNFIDDKKLDIKVADAVAEALSKAVDETVES